MEGETIRLELFTDEEREALKHGDDAARMNAAVSYAARMVEREREWFLTAIENFWPDGKSVNWTEEENARCTVIAEVLAVVKGER